MSKALAKLKSWSAEEWLARPTPSRGLRVKAKIAKFILFKLLRR